MFDILERKYINFSGVKIALIYRDKIVSILRDDIPGIPYPNKWDLPGGGRENNETPFETINRELKEELDINIAKDLIIWVKEYQGIIDPSKSSIFIVANISAKELEKVKFGDEGQKYKLFDITDFINNESVILQLRERLKDYEKLYRI